MEYDNLSDELQSDELTPEAQYYNMSSLKSTNSAIHQPRLYKRTSSSQVSLRRFSILQSDNDMQDEKLEPSLSHHESDVEVFTKNRVLTDQELEQFEVTEEDDRSNSFIDEDFIEFSSSDLKKHSILNDASNVANGLLSDEMKKMTTGSEQKKEKSSILDVKMIDYFLDNSFDNKDFKKNIIELIKNLKIKKWYKHELNEDDIIIRKISGAMTNAIYQISHSEKYPSLLLRVYGPNVDSIIDREYELQVLARLSNLKIGPKLFGCFNNGRFEEFLESSTTLTKNDVRDDVLSYKIAKRMRELHFFVPLTKEEKKEGSVTWKRVDNWLDAIKNCNPKVLEYVCQVSSFDELKQMIETYKKYLNDNLKEKTLSFTHCDTQYGNLLKVDGEIVVIDFEYSGPNPASFDMANHFSEWMHDYHSSKPELLNPSKYPSKTEIATFLKGYNFSDTSGLYDDIIKARALANLHWALWGILQNGDNLTALGIEKDEEDETVHGEHGEGAGADIETFNFLKYAREKFKIVLGDWIQLHVIDEDLNQNYKSYKLSIESL